MPKRAKLPQRGQVRARAVARAGRRKPERLQAGRAGSSAGAAVRNGPPNVPRPSDHRHRADPRDGQGEDY